MLVGGSVLERSRLEQVDSPNARFPLLDGMRALAATLVFSFHAWFFLGCVDLGEAVHTLGVTEMRDINAAFAHLGEVGVAAFYLISAFLLYRPFARASLRDGPLPPLGPYVIKRAFRILPAYWAAVTLIGLLDPGTNVFSWHGLINQYLFGSLYTSGGLIRGSNTYMASWTIAVEVSFYVFLPVWAAAVKSVRRVVHRPLAVELYGLAGLGLIGVAWKLVAAQQISGKDWFGSTFAVLPASIDVFAVGMLLAVLSVRAEARGTGFIVATRQWAYWSWLLALILYILMCWTVDARGPFSGALNAQALGTGFLKIPIALLLVLPALSSMPQDSLIGMGLSSRLVVWIGTVSYGLYLWHVWAIEHLAAWGSGGVFPPLDHRVVELFPLNASIAYILTLGIAALSWYGLERRTLGYGHALAARLGQTPRAKQAS